MLIKVIFWGTILIIAVVLGAAVPPLGMLMILVCVLYACRKLFRGDWN